MSDNTSRSRSRSPRKRLRGNGRVIPSVGRHLRLQKPPEPEQEAPCNIPATRGNRSSRRQTQNKDVLGGRSRSDAILENEDHMDQVEVDRIPVGLGSTRGRNRGRPKSRFRGRSKKSSKLRGISAGSSRGRPKGRSRGRPGRPKGSYKGSSRGSSGRPKGRPPGSGRSSRTRSNDRNSRSQPRNAERGRESDNQAVDYSSSDNDGEAHLKQIKDTIPNINPSEVSQPPSPNSCRTRSSAVIATKPMKVYFLGEDNKAGTSSDLTEKVIPVPQQNFKIVDEDKEEDEQQEKNRMKFIPPEYLIEATESDYPFITDYDADSVDGEFCEKHKIDTSIFEKCMLQLETCQPKLEVRKLKQKSPLSREMELALEVLKDINLKGLKRKVIEHWSVRKSRGDILLPQLNIPERVVRGQNNPYLCFAPRTNKKEKLSRASKASEVSNSDSQLEATEENGGKDDDLVRDQKSVVDLPGIKRRMTLGKLANNSS